MNETYRYAETMRTVVAGLGLLRKHAQANGLDVATTDLIYAAESRIADEIPPWTTDPDTTEIPWSAIVPGDSVQAPNGTWYPVDSVARLDVERMSVLLVAPSGTKIPSKPKAQDKVPTRRGDAGRAVDVFRAGGLELEVIGK